jgi:hypothetical protein
MESKVSLRMWLIQDRHPKSGDTPAKRQGERRQIRKFVSSNLHMTPRQMMRVSYDKVLEGKRVSCAVKYWR